MKHLLTVILLLLSLCCCTSEGEKSRMRAGLDSLNQRNRNDQPFTVADVEPYVQFFDGHGTPNDRMLGHYLMGRAYHEQGEAPMALQCYQDAIDCADTTTANCDFCQLSRVYAQMAEVYYDQSLYRMHLETYRIAADYAHKGHDTLALLLCYEQQSVSYKALNVLDSAVLIAEKTAKYYHELGYRKYSAVILGSISRILINMQHFEKAEKYIKIYEENSGLVDDKGDIAEGREIYFHVKGLISIHDNKLDSAEYWFRKELRKGKSFNNQNGGAIGLAMLYKQLKKPDSVAKYYQYAYAMNDSMHENKVTQEIIKMHSLYNYTHNQKKAHQESERANRTSHILWMTIAISIILILVSYLIIYHVNRKRKEAQQEYKNSLVLIEQAQYDIAKLKDLGETRQGLIQEKDRTIENLRVLIEERSYNKKSDDAKKEKKLIDSAEYQHFSKLSVKGLIPSDEDWQKLHIKMFELFPNFHQLLITKRHLLNQNEFNACFLVRMHFKPSDIINMLSVSSAYSTKIRKNLLQKLFDVEGKAEEFDNKITEIF